MSAMEYASSTKYGLRASGSTLKFPGWKAVYGATVEALAGEEEPAEDEVEEGTLPELQDGETLSIFSPPGVVGTHKQTEPPPYFNEASLVKKLEEEGIASFIKSFETLLAGVEGKRASLAAAAD